MSVQRRGVEDAEEAQRSTASFDHHGLGSLGRGRGRGLDCDFASLAVAEGDAEGDFADQGAGAVVVVGPTLYVEDVQCSGREARLEGRVGGRGGAAVVGADVLADVAAVEPVADGAVVVLREERFAARVMMGRISNPPRLTLDRQRDLSELRFSLSMSRMIP